MRLPLLPVLAVLSVVCNSATAYQSILSSTDFVRQTCSGMWKKTMGIQQDPFIEVLFTDDSVGEAAMVFYEWSDSDFIGKSASGSSAEEQIPVVDDIKYVCDADALSQGYCTADELGKFIVSLPEGRTLNDTSIQTMMVLFPVQPLRYEVHKTGYYCVGIVPINTRTSADQEETITTYSSVIDFENVFKGFLPSSEYPKIPFYFGLTFVYVLLAGAWTFLCVKHRQDLLPIQHYVSGAIGLVIVEMSFTYAYYYTLNTSTKPALPKAFLILVSITNAARTTMSLFVLCLVCMGYGVVKTNLGRVMNKVRILAIAHFVFGVAETLGTILIPVEKAGIFVLAFIIPSSLTLTTFIVWTLMSLNATIADLNARKQMYKMKMYKRLDRIIVCTIIALFAFFLLLGFAFTSRLELDYEAKTWRTRWILLDGYLSILYLLVFSAVAFLWRPSSNNRRLAMSDEVATDDTDDFELADANMPDSPRGYDEVPRSNRTTGDHDREVVFDIGAYDVSDDDDETSRLRKDSSYVPPSDKERTD